MDATLIEIEKRDAPFSWERKEDSSQKQTLREATVCLDKEFRPEESILLDTIFKEIPNKPSLPGVTRRGERNS
jgi:hypothetical protein